MLDDFLRTVGTSYLEQCLAEGKLLVPSQLDTVMLQRYAPRSVEDGARYIDRRGLALCSEQGNKHVGVLRLDQNSIKKKGRRKRKMTLDLGRVGIFAETEEVLLKAVDIFMRSKGIQECAVLKMTTEKAGAYFAGRYAITRLGKQLYKIGHEMVDLTRRRRSTGPDSFGFPFGSLN